MKTILKSFLVIFFLLISSVKTVYALDCQDISGTIRDPQGIPVGNVVITVSISGQPSIHTVFTREDGTFFFPYPVSGNIALSATKSGYLPITSAILSCSGSIFVMIPESTPTSPPGKEPRCGTPCATSTQCELASDGCSYCYSGTCIDPERIPPPTPNITPAYEQAIDFNQLKNAIPGLKSIFQPGPSSNVGGIISTILPYLYVIAGLLLLFYLIYGGFHMMTAANDEKGLVEARGKITNALVGFLILFLAYWIVQIMEYILGIQIF